MKVRSRTDHGSSSFSSNSNTNVVGYHLEDDDLTDSYQLEIYNDAAFGTPVFKMNEEFSETSCPYEGGYQIDQPYLLFADGTTEFTLEDIPNGAQPTFAIDVCNESDSDRYYNLKVNPATNTEGANGRNDSRYLIFRFSFFCISTRRGSAIILLAPNARGPNSILP